MYMDEIVLCIFFLNDKREMSDDVFTVRDIDVHLWHARKRKLLIRTTLLM